jgi:serine/threonine protein kinase/tetratricopeptide (TPR) repeat protein
MQCPECGFENPSGTHFCGKCGTRFSQFGKADFTATMQKPREELTTGSAFAGRYRIIEELGRGGMGTVYKVHDTKINEKIALKLLKPEIASDKKAIERFSNELKLARGIRHKNVCQMFDLGEDKGTHFITMEFVDGQDLKSMFRMSGRPAAETVLNIGRQIGEGLAEAHRAGVVHRDLKPPNIMVDTSGTVRIMDFGIARAAAASDLTAEGVILGTPGYMAPEQIEAGEADHRSDIYSLGVIFYEMATGNRPFAGDTLQSIAAKQKQGIPAAPHTLNPEIPESLSRIILKCLEPDRKNRWQGAEELAAALDTAGQPLPEPAGKSGWKTSIAILPFKNMSADPEQEYFCEGLAEELINALTQIKELRVVARTSAFSFKGKEIDIREIGRKLDVKTVLEGSVRKSGTRLRITAQLINIADGFHLWSERFDRELTDIFAIQDEISAAIMEKLKLEFLQEEEEGMVKRYTQDFEIYNLYLKGLYWRRTLDVDRVKKSVACFKQIIEKNPDYAPAYAALGYAYLALSSYGPVSSGDVYPEAKRSAQKAIALDDELVEAHEALAAVHIYFEWDWESGKKHLEKAMELNPGYAWIYFHLANIYLWRKELDNAVCALEKVIDLDPLNVAAHRNLGEVYLYAGQLDKAAEVLNRAIEMDPDFVYTHTLLGLVYMRKQKYREALRKIKKDSLMKDLRDQKSAVVYALMGKTEEARRILERYDEPSENRTNQPYTMAQLCFVLGEDDRGFAWLEKAFRDHDIWTTQIKVDFLLERVREDPRYGELLKKIDREKKDFL